MVKILVPARQVAAVGTPRLCVKNLTPREIWVDWRFGQKIFFHLFPKDFLARPLTSVKPADAGQGMNPKGSYEQREVDHITGQALRTPVM